MSQLIASTLLPLVLAGVMFVMGTSLTSHHFVALWRQPKALALGLCLQLLALPLLAWALIGLLPLPFAVAAGLVLLASAPGGATSNLFSYIARGDTALSITLTGLTSLLAPLWMPISIPLQLSWLASHQYDLQLPYLPSVMQLLMVTILPVSLGMLVRAVWPIWCQQAQVWLKRVALVALLTVIIALIAANASRMHHVLGWILVSILALSSAAMLLGYQLARWVKASDAHAKTLCFEVGIQNGALAALVAFQFLQQPDFSTVPLFYGLLVNLPAGVALALFLRQKMTST